MAHPLGYVLRLGLYGCGVVLVAESVARWRKGWLAVLPFGGAYRIAEEGFGTKVFLDPHQQWVITGIPGAYGRWAWVQRVPATGIDLFHAAISIGLERLGDARVLAFSVALVGPTVWRWRNPAGRPLTGPPPSGHRADRSSVAP